VIAIVPYNPDWPQQFTTVAAKIRAALGPQALAVHHIGSTAVPGLVAKNIIDVQVSVSGFEPEFRSNLEAAGLVWRDQVLGDHTPPGMSLPASELEKRFCQDRQERAANIHLRIPGRFNWRYALLCRDYLRAHDDARDAYAEIKRQLARYFPVDLEAYYDIKDPVFDLLMAGANDWASSTHWQPGHSDA
jgi:GrpB-like predicted nucleotidyltransferase (UPF0157 family)